MSTVNARQVLSNLYGLMMEINFHRADEDILSELNSNPDKTIDGHLLNIKRLRSKLKAQASKEKFQLALEQLTLLKQKGIGELQKLLDPQAQQQLVPLFRKFEGLTKEDEQSILEDQELLRMLELLKDKLDETNE